MRAGKLREVVRFERRDRVDDGYGNFTSGDWLTLETVRGELVIADGDEAVEAGRVQSSNLADLMVRSSTRTRSLKTSDRVVIKEELWSILSITNPDRRNHMLRLKVERGVAQ